MSNKCKARGFHPSASRTIAILGLALISAIIAACGAATVNPAAPTPLPHASATVSTDPVSDESPESSAAATTAVSAAAVAGPTISAIGGLTNFDSGLKNGLVSIDSCGTAYNGHRAVDDGGRFPWYLSGTNFGTTPGTITLGGQVLKVGSWTNTAITVNPTIGWSSGPMSTWLTVRTAAGTQTTAGVNIVPAISTRVIGQCTYGVAWWRKTLGLQPSPTAYGNYASINGSYRPAVGDQYQWTTQLGKHTAIAIKVSAPVTSGSTVTWTVTIAETNMDCKGGVRQFDTKFAVNGNTVTIPLRHSSLGNTSLYYR